MSGAGPAELQLALGRFLLNAVEPVVVAGKEGATTGVALRQLLNFLQNEVYVHSNLTTQKESFIKGCGTNWASDSLIDETTELPFLQSAKSLAALRQLLLWMFERVGGGNSAELDRVYYGNALIRTWLYFAFQFSDSWPKAEHRDALDLIARHFSDFVRCAQQEGSGVHSVERAHWLLEASVAVFATLSQTVLLALNDENSKPATIASGLDAMMTFLFGSKNNITPLNHSLEKYCRDNNNSSDTFEFLVKPLCSILTSSKLKQTAMVRSLIQDRLYAMWQRAFTIPGSRARKTLRYTLCHLAVLYVSVPANLFDQFEVEKSSSGLWDIFYRKEIQQIRALLEVIVQARSNGSLAEIDAVSKQLRQHLEFLKDLLRFFAGNDGTVNNNEQNTTVFAVAGSLDIGTLLAFVTRSAELLSSAVREAVQNALNEDVSDDLQFSLEILAPLESLFEGSVDVLTQLFRLTTPALLLIHSSAIRKILSELFPPRLPLERRLWCLVLLGRCAKSVCSLVSNIAVELPTLFCSKASPLFLPLFNAFQEILKLCLEALPLCKEDNLKFINTWIALLHGKTKADGGTTELNLIETLARHTAGGSGVASGGSPFSPASDILMSGRGGKRVSNMAKLSEGCERPDISSELVTLLNLVLPTLFELSTTRLYCLPIEVKAQFDEMLLQLLWLATHPPYCLNINPNSITYDLVTALHVSSDTASFGGLLPLTEVALLEESGAPSLCVKAAISVLEGFCRRTAHRKARQLLAKLKQSLVAQTGIPTPDPRSLDVQVLENYKTAFLYSAERMRRQTDVDTQLPLLHSSDNNDESSSDEDDQMSRATTESESDGARPPPLSATESGQSDVERAVWMAPAPPSVPPVLSRDVPTDLGEGTDFSVTSEVSEEGHASSARQAEVSPPVVDVVSPAELPPPPSEQDPSQPSPLAVVTTSICVEERIITGTTTTTATVVSVQEADSAGSAASTTTVVEAQNVKKSESSPIESANSVELSDVIFGGGDDLLDLITFSTRIAQTV